jgi:hypothetical protein
MKKGGPTVNLEAVKERYSIITIYNGYFVAERKKDGKVVRLDYKYDDRGYSNFKEA